MSLYILDLMGVAVFAASGALAAGRKSMDLLGVIVIAAVTAVGGGTLRDLLLDRHPVFWMSDPLYLTVILVVAVVTMVYVRWRRPPLRALAVADAFGLGLFTISGAQIAEHAGMSALIVILLATMTAVAGGVLRDVLSAEVPLILRRDIYATAAVCGAAIYLLAKYLELSGPIPVVIGVIVVVALRLSAIVWGLQLPVVTPRSGET
jgi:uncharacterized membrane protein YeiH